MAMLDCPIVERRMRVRWSAFIDESGDFTPSMSSVVAALLVAVPGDALAGRRRLRSEIEAIWGPGPYPPHTTNLNYPAAAVLYFSREDGWLPRGMKPGRFIGPVRQHLRKLARQLQRGRFARRFDQIRAGAVPTYSDILTAHLLLREHPDYKAVHNMQERQRRAMGDLLARIFRHFGTDRAAVVAALADNDPHGPEPERYEVRRDPYTRALSVVMERIGRLVGQADVEFYVLPRLVQAGDLGSAPLRGYLLRRLLDEAAQGPGCSARFHQGAKVYGYQDDPEQGSPLHPMLVFADFVANRLRYVLAHHRGGYKRLVESLVDRAIVPGPEALWCTPHGRQQLGPLPTLAAAGDVEDAVRLAFEGQSAPALTQLPLWVHQQARMWISAAGRWT